jgi:tetratricopeptide (TPR) repeat protein
VLAGAFEETPAIETISSWEDVPGRDGRHPGDTRLDPVAAKETLDQLVALGYIDQPDADMEKALARTVRELRYNLCESYQDADRHEEALEIARELYEANPDEQRFAVRVFVSCQALGRLDEMRRLVADLDGRRRELYVEAVRRVKGLRAVSRKRVAERKAAGESVPTPPRGRKRKREPLLTPEERAEFDHWSSLARYQPATVEFLKAQILAADHKWFDALQCLERVQDAHLARPGLFLQTAELYRRLRRFEEAEQTYRKALGVDPDNPHVHVGLARMALRRRDYASSAHSALECVQRLYHYPMAHLILGLAISRLGHYERAVEALRVALALNPNFPQAHRLLATLLRRLNDPAGAEEHRRAYRGFRRSQAQPGGLAEPRRAPALHPRPVRPVDAPELPPIDEEVFVVSGLPRSGTSMVMQMLAAGGMPVLTDGLRAADEDNPLGYFEYEPVKALQSDAGWIAQARGKAVKIVAPLLRALPGDCRYRVVFVDRDLDEVLASQSQMLIRRGKSVDDTPARRQRIRRQYERIVGDVKAALPGRPNVRFLTLDRAAVFHDPRAAADALNRFAGGSLAVAAMAAAIKPELHRQRRA